MLSFDKIIETGRFPPAEHSEMLLRTYIGTHDARTRAACLIALTTEADPAHTLLRLPTGPEFDGLFAKHLRKRLLLKILRDSTPLNYVEVDLAGAIAAMKIGKPVAEVLGTLEGALIETDERTDQTFVAIVELAELPIRAIARIARHGWGVEGTLAASFIERLETAAGGR